MNLFNDLKRFNISTVARTVYNIWKNISFGCNVIWYERFIFFSFRVSLIYYKSFFFWTFTLGRVEQDRHRKLESVHHDCDDKLLSIRHFLILLFFIKSSKYFIFICQSKICNCNFFFIFTWHTAHNRVSRGNLLLRYSVLQFWHNIWDIAR